jgi:hypothetical protein
MNDEQIAQSSYDSLDGNSSRFAWSSAPARIWRFMIALVDGRFQSANPEYQTARNS